MARSPKGSIVHAIPSFYPRRMATATLKRPSGTGLTDNAVFYNNSQDGSYLVVWDVTVTVAQAASQTTIPVVQGGPNPGGLGSGAGAISFVNSAVSTAPSGTTIQVSVPSGTQVNDLLLAIISVFKDPATTVPAGWTLAPATVNGGNLDGGGVSAGWFEVWYKFAAASEASSYLWGWSGGSAYPAAIMAAYRNVSAAKFYDVSQYPASGSGSTTLTAPSITTTLANDWLLSIFTTQPAEPAYSSGPSPAMTLRNKSDAVSNSLCGVYLADLALGAAGNIAAEVLTFAGTVAGNSVSLSLAAGANTPPPGAGTNYSSVSDQGGLPGSWVSTTGGSLQGASPYTFLEGAGNWRWGHDFPFVVIRPGASYQFQLTGDTGGWAVSLIWEVVRNL